MQFEFFIPEIHGKGRPRFSSRSGTSYTDARTRKYERDIRFLCGKAMKDAGILHPTDKPVTVSITAYFKISKSGTKAVREAKRQNLMVPGRPDVDNIAKAVFDGMNGVAYLDDQQIRSCSVTKLFSDELFGVAVSVYWDHESEN